MISISHLTKAFGRTQAVCDLSLMIAPGESVALWGANGAGKTTVIRCVTGLYRYQGQITIDGVDARREGKRARGSIGYVPQELGFNDDLRVAEAMRLFASLRGVSVDHSAALLERVQLRGHERKRMRELSGGMKQRLALAIALIGDPPVLLLDEVTSSLDTVGRTELVALLASIAKDQRRSVLFASHRVDEIEMLASRVAMLDRGRLVSELPAGEFVKRFGGQSLLHLSIDALLRERAIAVLRQTGLDAQMNGRGILVPVGIGDRMRPLRVLERHQIAVDTFDLLASHPDRSHA